MFTKTDLLAWRFGFRQNRRNPDETELRYMYAEERDYYMNKTDLLRITNDTFLRLGVPPLTLAGQSPEGAR
jgi:hypothetical protein